MTILKVNSCLDFLIYNFVVKILFLCVNKQHYRLTNYLSNQDRMNDAIYNKRFYRKLKSQPKTTGMAQKDAP